MDEKENRSGMRKESGPLGLGSLFFRLSLVLIGIPTLILVAFGFFRIRTQTLIFEKELDALVKLEALQLATSLSIPLFNFDEKTCRAITLAALEKKEIIKITVFDQDRVYFCEDKPAQKSTGGTAEKWFEAPIKIESNPIGKVRVEAGTAFLDAKVAEFKRGNLLLIVSLDIIMGLLLILVLNIGFIRPLQELRKSSQKIAAGHLDYPVNIKRSDELGDLADNFVVMRDAIKEKVENLQLEIEHHLETSHALEKSEAFLRLILDLIPHSVLVKDKDGTILIANQAVARDMGCSLDALAGMHFSRVVSDSGRAARILADDRQVIASGRIKSFITRIHQADADAFRWSLTKKVPFQNTGGEMGIVDITSDITELKQAEEALKKTKNYIDNIINSMPSALFSLDHDLNITLWNLKAQNIYGISPSRALQQPVGQVLPGFKPILGYIQDTIRTGEPHHFARQQLPGTDTLFEDITIYPLVTNQIEGAVIRVDDVTEKVRMEEMVLQSEKMMSIGGLAAGMAHEINNPLAGMMQNAQVILRRIQGNLPASIKAAEASGITLDQVRQFMESRGIIRQLNLIHDAGRRASKIVKNMLGFARRDDKGKIKQDITRILDLTVEVAQNDYDLKHQYDFKKIKIIKEYDPATPLVRCEAPKIQQVFFNILKNSAQAMQKNPSGKKPCFYLNVRPDGEFVKIEIEDNGPGIPTDLQKRVFEPFFTTKPVGQGTGLGLSVSYFIVADQHKGKMDVVSIADKGARFVIHLPVG